LKITTSALHERVEGKFDLRRKVDCLATYRSLLERLLGLHLPLEAALGRVEWADRAIDIAKRRKSNWLVQDLRALGHSGSSLSRIPACPLPPVVPRATAFGWLYTLEGATLGGRVILREAQRRLGVSEDWAGRFFWGYGPQTAAAWRAFTAVLNTIEPDSPAADAVIEGAEDMFSIYERWVLEPLSQSLDTAPTSQEMLLA
jgi:heme oxygenase